MPLTKKQQQERTIATALLGTSVSGFSILIKNSPKRDSDLIKNIVKVGDNYEPQIKRVISNAGAAGIITAFANTINSDAFEKVVDKETTAEKKIVSTVVKENNKNLRTGLIISDILLSVGTGIAGSIFLLKSL